MTKGEEEDEEGCTSPNVVIDTIAYDYILIDINVTEAVVVIVHPLMFAAHCLTWCGGNAEGQKHS